MGHLSEGAKAKVIRGVPRGVGQGRSRGVGAKSRGSGLPEIVHRCRSRSGGKGGDRPWLVWCVCGVCGVCVCGVCVVCVVCAVCGVCVWCVRVVCVGVGVWCVVCVEC